MKVVISSGHGKYVRGASGSPIPPYCDEVDEARKVVEETAKFLRQMGVETTTYHDDVSKTQSENLTRIVDFHNSRSRNYDLSIHFNAFEQGSAPKGCEVLWKTQEQLATTMVNEICLASGLKNRGAKRRDDLKFLNATEEKALLVEVAFCDSSADCAIYRENFQGICLAIAASISGQELPATEPDPTGLLFSTTGTCSHFGGPDDQGVSPSEGLAFHYALTEANQHLFLPLQPHGTTGLARRLNSKAVHYVACRWDYSVTPKEMLAGPKMALVRATVTGIELPAFPADWGPHEEQTGRAADLSPALMKALGISTDSEVSVFYPWEG